MPSPPSPPGALVLDGSQGEGGGQILRTALSLAAANGRPLRIERIRAGRPRPGLAAQHLAAVRALAALCGARLDGDTLGSSRIDFAPAHQSRAGAHVIDIGAARAGGSAGSTTLVLEAMLQALVGASGRSTLVLRGGTHVAWSPPFEYVRDVWLPALAEMGIRAQVELVRCGFHPVGGGEISATLDGVAPGRIAPLARRERGPLVRVAGTIVSSGVARHVPDRLIARARAELAGARLAVDVDFEATEVDAACPGVALHLTAHYASACAGFGALGERRKPAERVADEATRALLAFHRSGAAVDQHLADQLLVVAALASGPSELTVERVTRHLTTNAWVIEQLGLAQVSIEEREREHGAARVTVRPR